MRVLLDVTRIRSALHHGLAGFTVASLCGCSGGDGFRSSPTTTQPAGTIEVEATATVLKCPKIDSYSVSPVKYAAGVDVYASVTASSTSELTPAYSWVATSGTFSDPKSSVTKYRCGLEIGPTITLTVYGGDCAESVNIAMDCK